jgi:3-dehydroquinate synthase
MTELHCERAFGFRICLERGVLDPASPALARAIGDRRALIVTTPTVAMHYGTAFRRACAAAGVDVALAVRSLDEQHKTMDAVMGVAALARSVGIGRRDVLIGFGGGVTTDVVSLAASLYRRGVACIRMPTSLVGQVDAGIGLKSAVNAGGVKSALGRFDPPELVLEDPTWLTTLPARATRSGFAEIVKIAMVRDAALFELVELVGCSLVASQFTKPEAVVLPLLERSIELMVTELRQNPFEECLERLVDFGHTFSPALEIESAHVLTHGEAVAIDMAISTEIAVILGHVTSAEADRIVAVLHALGLPTTTAWATTPLLAAAADAAVAHRGGALNLVVPTGIGTAGFVRERDEIGSDLLDFSLAAVTARTERVSGRPAHVPARAL